MILIDSNALIVLLLGLIDPKLLGRHKTSSIYDEEDFNDLLGVIADYNNLVTLPNVWTEVDNLLNRFSGDQRYIYISQVTDLIKKTSETYLSSSTACEAPFFLQLGLTDSLILEYAEKCKLLITSDSTLSDYAIAKGIKVYDMVKIKNEKLK